MPADRDDREALRTIPRGDVEELIDRKHLDRWEREADKGQQTQWKWRFRMAMAWLHGAEDVIEAGDDV